MLSLVWLQAAHSTGEPHEQASPSASFLPDLLRFGSISLSPFQQRDILLLKGMEVFVEL